MRNIQYLVIHTSATPQSWSIQRLSNYFLNLFGVRKENRGYHVVIEADGKVTRRFADSIASSFGVRNFKGDDIDISNANTVHIAYIGGIDDNGNGIDNRTPSQVKSMNEVVQWYVKTYPTIKVLGHNQVANKYCPCFSVPKYLRALGIPEKNIYATDNFNVLKWNKLL